jgi:sugar lactone lactonase YvrE
VVDIDNNVVLKVDPQGTLSIFAGNGLYGFSGDGGPATLASLNDPAGLAVDSSGNLYIADSGNNRIRKVTPDGIISTVAGTGDAGYTGDRGASLAATLDTPSGIAVDRQGNLIIADANNHVIRKVSGGTITTIAGTGDEDYDGDGGPATEAAFDYPVAVAVDPSGNIFVADYNNYVVRKINASNGRISTYAGNGDYDSTGDGGQATKASLEAPGDVAVDSAGNLFIADTDDSRIRMVTPGGIISTVAGKGSATGFSGAFSGDGKAATAAELNNPNAVTVDTAGNLYIGDGDNYRVRKVTGGIISTVAGNGSYSFGGDGEAATGIVAK